MPKKPTIQLPPLDLGDETFGQRLARVRKERGYTQVELAEKMGTIQSLISAFERDKLRMNAEMVVRIAIALGVSTDILLGLDADKRKGAKVSRKVIRRLERIEDLPLRHQRALLKTIDVYLKGAAA